MLQCNLPGALIMSKKNNSKNYLELMLISLVILDAYLYSRTNGDDKYNDPYNYPHKTLYNWAPTALASLLLTTTFLTSLILLSHPQVERVGGKTSNKSLDKLLLYGPATMALAQKIGSLLATSLLGDRADAINSVTDNVLAKTEIATHVIVSGRQVHNDLIERSIYNSETEEYQIRVIEKIGHSVIAAYVASVETIAAYMIATGLITRYVPIAHDDSKTTEMGKFLSLVSLVNVIGRTIISDHFLAIKIIIDKPVISKILKTLNIAGRGVITFKNTDLLDKVGAVAQEYAEQISEAFKKFEENTVEFLLKRKEELELKIKDFTDTIEKLGQTIKDQAEKFALAIERQAVELGKKIEEQAVIIKEKFLEITNLKSLLEEANKIREALEQELQKVKAKLLEFQEQIKEGAEQIGEAIVEAAKYTQEELDKAATKLQANFRGFLARKHVNEMKTKKVLEDEASQLKAEPDGKDVSVDSKGDSKTLQPIATHHDERAQAKHHHHGVFGAIEDGLHNIGASLSSAFHPHRSSSGGSAEKNKAEVAKKESSTAAAQKGSSAQDGGAKTDKAANDDSSVFDIIYIQLNNSTQVPVITIDFSLRHQEKGKYPKPMNKEREEYENARAAAENKNETRVEYQYDGIVLEKPQFYTVPTKYGIEVEISNNLDNLALMGDNHILYAM